MRRRAVLVHSSGLGPRQWQPLQRLLPQLDLLTPSLIGYGGEPWQGGDFHHHQDRDQLVSTLRGLPEPVDLFGHSYGGLLALQASLCCPDRIRSLTLYEPVTFSLLYPDPGPSWGRDPEPFLRRDHGLEAWLSAFFAYWNGPGAWQGMTEPRRRYFLRRGEKIYAEVASLCRDRTDPESYRSLSCPVLILSGESPNPDILQLSAVLEDLLPRSRWQKVPGAGHMGPVTHARDLAPIWMSFLKTQR